MSGQIPQLDRIEAKLDQLLKLSLGPAPTFNPDCFSMPKEWTGPDMKGRKFSECTPELLGMMAVMYERFGMKAQKEGSLLKNGKPKADWDRKLMEAAQKWARYNSANGATLPATQTSLPIECEDNSDIPF